jgi:hemoglobin/transferrin/lactoferrin receptor protein
MATEPSSDNSRSVAQLALAAALLFSIAVPMGVAAQNAGEETDTLVYKIDPLLVTATRGLRAISDTPRPVSVLQRRDLNELLPNTVADLFRDLPGLDVTGVGISQVRPQIRGQSGQRILMLNDGLRMNNTRRQRDFGELTALVDVSAIEQVEVVRGPASVLYGSDAIGGVVNIITKTPTEEGFSGTGSYLFGDVESQNRISARASGRTGAFSIQVGGMWREANSYEAPAGEFGDISLANVVAVENSGVEDRTMDMRLGWDFTPTTSLFTKVENYAADNAGFGYVAPADYAPDEAEINIRYPKQRFTKFSTGFRARDMNSALADLFSLTAYGQDNERELVFGAFFPFGQGLPPDAGVDLDNRNYTDIRTYGMRAEARKLVTGDVLLTYGLDGFQDAAEGTDVNTSTVFGFGPPMVDVSEIPSMPKAEYLSVGAFMQAELDIGERVSVVGGGRFQNVSAESFATPLLDNTPESKSNTTGVWALNSIVEVTEHLDLVGSMGRGFRSPNLVELFFEGSVAEAGAYQIVSEGLKAETSLNYDIGARYQMGSIFLEGFLFRNKVSDGIRGKPVTGPAGDTVQIDGFDAYQNVNVDEIVLQGVELNADVRLLNGLGFGATYATLDAEDAFDPDNPIGESYSRKLTGRAGYHDPTGRFWGRWDIRYSGEQKDAVLSAGNPLGTVLPSFRVQNVRAGVRLMEMGGVTHGLVMAVTNITNELYAETANASFFRPEPRRNVTITWNVSF